MKTAVVTGGNSGIGFETARELARRGWRVIITGRDETKLRAAADAIGEAASIQVADFAAFADVRALGAALNQEPRIDVLINNIGVSLSRKQVSRDGNDMMLQVNHLSPFLLTYAVARQAQGVARPRASSMCPRRMHGHARDFGFDDLQFARSYTVAKVKMRGPSSTTSMFTRELARRLAGSGVTANALHPGMIQTEIGHGRRSARHRGIRLASAAALERPSARGGRTRAGSSRDRAGASRRERKILFHELARGRAERAGAAGCCGEEALGHERAAGAACSALILRRERSEPRRTAPRTELAAILRDARLRYVTAASSG